MKKDYHFENEEHDLEQTIRLDDINEKLKRLEQTPPEDDLGDKEDYLNAFESEKLQEDSAEQPSQDTPLSEQEPPDEEYDEEAFFGLSKRGIGLLAAIGVVACMLGFMLARCGFHPAPEPKAEEGVPVLMLVEDVTEGEKLEVYDIGEEQQRTVTLSEETTVRDENERTIASDTIKAGDLVMIELSEDGETVRSVYYGGKIQTKEMTGLAVDTAKRTLSDEEETITYHKKTMFRYEGEDIDPGDLAPCDVLLLKGTDDMVWSVEVLEYHGTIVLENKKEIQNGKIQIDEEEALSLNEVERLPVSGGMHTLTITGDNIETRKDRMFIEAGTEYPYDLSQAQQKVGVLIVNANVSEYKLYINGTATDASSPAVLPFGEYDLVILKNGYHEWNQHVMLNEASMTVRAELQRDLEYGTLTVTSDVDGAAVYIDGEESGVTPLEINLLYGSYAVRLEKRGYHSFEQRISINQPAVSLYAEME